MRDERQRFQEHVQKREVSPPPRLYKYVSWSTAELILSGRKLRFQSPLNYNDPFDSQWEPLWSVLTPEAKALQRKLLENALRDRNSWPVGIAPRFRQALSEEQARIAALPSAERDRAIEAMLLELASLEEVPDAVRAKVHDMRRRMRVLCLSANPTSLLMWSHYADSHRGVLLEFDTVELENGLQRPLEPVVYSESLPSLMDPQAWARAMIFGLPTPPLGGAERAWALTKSLEWKYEEEWRFVTVASRGTSGEYEDYDIPRGALVGAVVGCRADRSRVPNLKAAIAAVNPKARLSVACEHPSRFEIVIRNCGEAE